MASLIWIKQVYENSVDPDFLASLGPNKWQIASLIWNPAQKTQVKQIEQVQRNAGRWVMIQPYSPLNLSSVTEMLNKLKWPSLEQRRVWTDVTLFFVSSWCVNLIRVFLHDDTLHQLDGLHASLTFLVLQQQQNLGQRFGTSKMHLSPPV